MPQMSCIKSLIEVFHSVNMIVGNIEFEGHTALISQVFDSV